MENRVTKKNKFEMLREALGLLGEVSHKLDVDMLNEFIDNEIAALDNKSAKAKERAAAKKTERDELCDVVLSVLTAEPQTRDEISNRILQLRLR